jgi:16S rRNA (guanine527-N7)-methyltransferase
MAAIDGEQIRELLQSYGFSAAPEYCDRVVTYIGLLLRWNKKISLTTVTEALEIIRFHFGESLAAIKAAGIKDGRLADVGSGAGFPGMPIAMATPGLETLLIESNAKKAAFLAEVKREIRVENVTIHRGRSESVRKSEKFDFVTARAVGKHGEVLDWARSRLLPSGKVVLWVSSEAFPALGRLDAWRWQEPVHLAGTKDRFVLIGSPSSRPEAHSQINAQ